MIPAAPDGIWQLAGLLYAHPSPEKAMAKKTAREKLAAAKASKTVIMDKAWGGMQPGDILVGVGAGENHEDFGATSVGTPHFCA